MFNENGKTIELGVSPTIVSNDYTSNTFVNQVRINGGGNGDIAPPREKI